MIKKYKYLKNISVTNRHEACKILAEYYTKEKGKNSHIRGTIMTITVFLYTITHISS